MKREDEAESAVQSGLISVLRQALPPWEDDPASLGQLIAVVYAYSKGKIDDRQIQLRFRQIIEESRQRMEDRELRAIL